MSSSIFLANEADNAHQAQIWAKHISIGSVIYLVGDLGAGKTTFARHFLRALGYDGTVKSPTYTIVESYSLPKCEVHHFDLYRFQTPEEWEDAGLDDLFHSNSICLIEWPSLGGEFVPQPDWVFEFSYADNARSLRITPQSETAKMEAQQWQN